MKKPFTILCSLMVVMAALAQDVTLTGPAGCNGAAVTGTWTVPCNVTAITVDVYGGGGGAGGGGGGSNGGLAPTRGGGGGGGAAHSSVTINVTPGATFNYTIGAGGCGGDNGSDGNRGDDGTSGVASFFTGTDNGGTIIGLTAGGGVYGGSGSGSGNNPGNGGAGGTATGGSTNTAGTAGSAGNGGNGGAGGAAAGPAGGAGGAATNNPGSTYGGGGAGGGDSDGGNGGTGGILITYTATIPGPDAPQIANLPATCTGNGTSAISNYDANTIYTFTPTGPTVGAGGAISGMLAGTAYTVVAEGSCVSSAPSSSFTNEVQLTIPNTPDVISTSAECTVNGSSGINNYDAAATYIFTPTGPLAEPNGNISGTTWGTTYTVVAVVNGCPSGASVAFTNEEQISASLLPQVVSLPATCDLNGSSTISNYNAAYTYTFTPSGPTAIAGGAIAGIVVATAYTVKASLGNCESVESSSFTNEARLTGSICDTGTVSINDVKGKLVSVSVYPNPAANQVNIDYSNVDHNNGNAVLQIANNLGQVVLSQTLAVNSAVQQVAINNYASGIYTISIKQNGATVAAGRLVKE